MSKRERDVIIVGGGLAGGLVALALAGRRPDLRVTLVEAGPSLGGNHVWSFFGSDVPPELRWLVKPLVVWKWRGYGVKFRKKRRQLPTSYNAITSKRLDEVLRAALPADMILCGTKVAQIDRRGVTLADGRRLDAPCVIDARGGQVFPGLVGGWQKFLGQRLKLAAPHGLLAPVVMDASVEQIDGYRFIYVLPFGLDEVFVEDTYYSTSPILDREVLAERIADYAAQKQWRVTEILGEERGILPVAAGGDTSALLRAEPGVARIGVGAGLFHPLTGYSLPLAAQVAGLIADLPDLDGESVAKAVAKFAANHWRGAWYYRLLARMAFGAAPPAQRHRIFARFYTLDARLIERFYAGRSSLGDRLRILVGRPPVSILAALRCLVGGGRPLARLDDLKPFHHIGFSGDEI